MSGAALATIIAAGIALVASLANTITNHRQAQKQEQVKREQTEISGRVEGAHVVIDGFDKLVAQLEKRLERAETSEQQCRADLSQVRIELADTRRSLEEAQLRITTINDRKE
jgi:sensor domain CHASE-containing protein